MIAATDAFKSEEARLRGAQAVVWITVFPKYFDSGIGDGGSFQECAYVAPDEIRADYHGFALGSWLGPQKFIDLGRYPSLAAVTWDWNSPGYEMSVWFRTAKTLAALDGLPWTPWANGATVNFYPYYQLKAEWRGYRCWTCPDGLEPDEFTAYALPDPEDPAEADYVSSAAPCHHPDDLRAYIKDVVIEGEFPIAEGDVEKAGRLTLEAPDAVDDLVAGDHTDVAVNNRQGKFSPGRAAFIFANEADWQNQEKYIKTEIGYRRPGYRQPEMVLMYLGRLNTDNWLNRAVDGDGVLQAHTAELYSTNLISKVLEYKIGQPDADGNPQPYCGGEFLAEAKKVEGRALVGPLRTVDFETAGLAELDRQITANGGALSVSSEQPLAGSVSLRGTAAAVGGRAQGAVMLRRAPAEFLAVLKLRLTDMPANPVPMNCTLVSLLNGAGNEVAWLEVGVNLKLTLLVDGWHYESSWEPRANENIPVELAILSRPGGQLRVWVNNSQVLNEAVGLTVQGIAVGPYNRNAAESWTIHADQIRLYPKYHDQAYQVPGWPFAQIKTVYRDDVPQTPGATLELLPDYGAVNFLPADGQDVSGTIKLLVRKDAIDHPVDHIQGLVTQAGAGDYLDAASLAACKAATPEYRVGVNFEKMTAGEAVKEICSCCLYYFFMDHALIRLAPFLGTAPVAPAELLAGINDLGSAELRECRLNPADRQDVKKRVAVKYGESDRNPGLCELAGSEDPNEDTADLDLSYGAPVCTDSAAMVRLLADRYLILVGPRQVFDPLRLSWRGARNELPEVVRVTDPFLADAPMLTRLQRKEINLDPPRETSLRAVRRYLEET